MVKNRNFFYLLTGQLVSQIGDKFHMIAVSFYVLETTGSSARMGAVLAASLIPSLILGFVSGAFIDRYNRKFIIIGTDLIRGFLLCLFASLFYFKMMNFSVILLMQVLLSINAAFFDPSIPSIIPQIVDNKDLASANSKHQFINGFATIAGAFLGGICITVFGYFWIFIINAISFILSAILECFINISSLKKNQNQADPTGIFKDMKQGYKYIFSNQSLMVLLFMIMVIHFFVGSMEVFMPVIADTISDNGVRTLGFFHAIFGFGTIFMAVVMSVNDISKKEKTTLFISVFIIGLLYVAASCFQGSEMVLTILFLGMIFLFGCCIICAGISFKTLLQKNIDNYFSGRVFAVAGSVGNASIPGAMIFYGVLLEKVAFQGLLFASGLVLMLLSIVLLMLYKEKKNVRSIKTRSKPFAQS